MRTIHGVIATAVVLALVAGVRAQEPVKPSMTVAVFSADKGARLSAKALEAMADGLAMQLVESTRFRVMDRTLLPIPGNPQRPSISAVRAAATNAGVQYVVAGAVSKFQETRYLQPFASRPQVLLPGRNPFMQPGAYGRPRAVRHDFLRVSVEVLDVRTGARMKLESATCPAPLGRGPIPALFKGSAMTTELERAMTQVARGLVQWNPAVSRPGL